MTDWKDPIVKRALFRGAVRGLPTAAIAVLGWWLLRDPVVLGLGCFLAGAWGFSETHQTVMRWMVDQYRETVEARR